MISSNSLSVPTTTSVIDTSVAINLNATGRSHEILKAFPGQFLITQNAVAELAAGASRGYSDAAALQKLVDRGLLGVVALDASALGTYEELIEGRAAVTLDDGEAATIAYALGACAAAVLDERKARSLCTNRYKALPIVSTAEILVHDLVRTALGDAGQREVIIGALRVGKMRVPLDQAAKIVGLIGDQEAATCTSLPRGFRP